MSVTPKPTVQELVDVGLPQPYAQALWSFLTATAINGYPDYRGLMTVLKRAQEDHADLS